MAIYARKPKSNFKPAPAGLHLAVCCDVWPPWTEEKKAEWGGGLVDKTRLVWQIEEKDSATGRPFEASRLYTLSLHEKATLRQHLEAWRSRPFTQQELEGFDLESVIGACCQLQIAHNIAPNGDVYANVQAIVALGKGMTKIRVSEDYVRHKDRHRPGENAQNDSQITDDDVPF